MPAADLLLSGGSIWRGKGLGRVEALAIAAGRVVAAGDRASVLDACGPETRRLDLGGGFALPAFNDPHLHLATLGFSLGELNLRGCSAGRLLEMTAQAVAGARPGQWITGRGFDEAALGAPLTLSQLDAAAPANPVLLRRVCGHQFMVNSAALALAGIDASTPDPQGGVIEREAGRATGSMLEEAGQLAVRAMPRPSLTDFKAAVGRAATLLVSQGITSVMDAAVGRAGYDELAALTGVAAREELPLRTWVCLYGGDGGQLERAFSEGLRFGTAIGRLRFGAAKLFADGSVGSGTAAFIQPYLDGGHGLLNFSDAEMREKLRRFHELGYQLAIHAIGDAAIEQVLSGMEKADSPAHPIKGRRHRIEHCGFLTDGQLARMAASGIDPVPQPAFIYEFGDLYVINLGEERAGASYPMRKWLDGGLHAAASSDAPVCATDPFKNLFTMVTRQTKRHTEIGGAEKLSMEEAVHAYTLLGAYTQFAEDKLGRLMPGQLADIAVLSHDIFAIPVEKVENEVRCDLTLLGGEVVFDRHGQLAAAAQ